MKTKMKAFGYLRFSGLGQAKGDTIARQKERIEAYACKHGIEVVAWFVDEAVSGKNYSDDKLELLDRDGLTDCFTAIEANGVRLVLVEQQDRLARQLITSELFLARFRKAGCQVVEVMGGSELTVDDDTDPTRCLIRQVLGAVAQYEKTSLVLKLRAARNRKRKTTGRCEGVQPFGTKEGEGPVVEKIKQLRSQGLTLRQIADRLNGENVPTRNGGEWAGQTVNSILNRS